MFVFWQIGSTLSHEYRATRVNSAVAGGMFLVIEPGEAWTCHSERFSFHGLSIDADWLQQFTTEMWQRERDLPHFPSHLLYDPPLCQAVCDLAVRSLTPASRLQQEETLLRVFAPLLLSHAEDVDGVLPAGHEHPAVRRAKAYLEAHYAEEVPLHELGNVVNMSPFHLARVFRQTVGVPPHAYQTQLRLACAKTLLAQGWEVGYVASETGFFDQSHFTQQFKRHYLVTPGSYRKTARFS